MYAVWKLVLVPKQCVALAATALVLLTSCLWLPTSSWAQDKWPSHSALSEAVAFQFFDSFEAYLNTLPRYQGYYVVHGDMLMTRVEVREYLIQTRELASRPLNASELVVKVTAADLDYLKEDGSRTLRYAVDKRSFDDPREYQVVVEAMEHAAADWVALCQECKIDIEHKTQSDTESPQPLRGKLDFVVRLEDSFGSFTATSFFPSYDFDRRYIRIDPSFFKVIRDPVDAMRHQLGHVLGYRHSYASDLLPCASRKHFVGNDLAANQPPSIMDHCDDTTAPNVSDLGDTDKRGHRCLYGEDDAKSEMCEGWWGFNPLARPDTDANSVRARNERISRYYSALQETPSVYELIARVEGGRVADEISRLLRQLLQVGVRFPTKLVQALPGDGVCRVLEREVDFPGGCSKSVVELVSDLNPEYESLSHELWPGQLIRLVDLQFEEYPFRLEFDLTKPTDVVRRKDLEENWQVWRQGPEKHYPTSSILEFVGYRFSIPLDVEQTAYAYTFLDPRQFTNLRFDIEQVDVRSFPRYGDYMSPSQHYDMCENTGALSSLHEAWYGKFVTSTGAPEAVISAVVDRKVCSKPCSGSNCPQIVLFDAPVASHPDLGSAGFWEWDPGRKEFSARAGDGRTQDPTCKRVGPIRLDQHGTHMASVVVSSKNGLGFVGLAPEARLGSVKIDGMRDSELEDIFIYGKTAGVPLQVFVFATSFSEYRSGVNKLQYTEYLQEVADAIQLKGLVQRIVDDRPLMIVAAGQPDNIHYREPINLRATSAMAPQNLGKRDHVVVVTACKDCSDGAAELLEKMNYSEDGLVHLAAPGASIPGIASSTEFGLSSGTSPAAAYVAGIAAAMVGCHPERYAQPYDVKTQLQITARPVLVGDDAKRVTSGIVDPIVAMLDPASDWVRYAGKDSHTKEKLSHWCKPDLSLQNFDGVVLPDTEEKTKLVRRIVRYRGKGAGEEIPQWVVYAEDNRTADDRGAMVRRGPGVVDTTIPLIKTEDGKLITLNQVEDVLIRKKLPDRPCTP